MNKNKIKELIKSFTDIPHLNSKGQENEVIGRRASTVRGWIEWIIGCQI